MASIRWGRAFGLALSVMQAPRPDFPAHLRRVSAGTIASIALVVLLSVPIAAAKGAPASAGHPRGSSSPIAHNDRGVWPCQPYLPNPTYSVTSAGPYSVSQTLVMFNDSLVRGNFPAAFGAGPTYLAYDAPAGTVFVSDCGSNAVSVLNDTRGTVVGTIPMGGTPQGLAYDSARGELFVALEHAGVADGMILGSVSPAEILVLSARNDSVLHTIVLPNGSYPLGMAYDPAQGEIFVTDDEYGSVWAISDSTDRVVANISVMGNPWGIAYDSGKAELFVTGPWATTVDVISATSNRVVATINAGTGGDVIVYDPLQGTLFLGNSQEVDSSLWHNITILSDATNSVVTSLTVASTTQGLVFDPTSDQVFVSEPWDGRILAVNAATDRLGASGTDTRAPYDLLYDPGQEEIWISNTGDDSVTGMSPSNFTPEASPRLSSFPQAITYDPMTNQLFLAETRYYPEGSGWATTVSGTTDQIVARTGAGDDPTAVALDPTLSELFVANYCSNSLTVVSSATDRAVATISFGSTQGELPSAIAYDAQRGETFVPLGQEVAVVSDANRSIVGWADNGRGARIAAAYDPARGEVFVVAGGAGSLSVISDQNNLVVATIPVPPGPAGIAYDPARGELFVASDGSHNVTVISDRSNQVVASIPVGYRTGGIAYVPQLGMIVVADTYAGAVQEISDANNTVLGTTLVGQNPTGIAFDSANGDLYVTNFGQGTISVIPTGATGGSGGGSGGGAGGGGGTGGGTGGGSGTGGGPPRSGSGGNGGTGGSSPSHPGGGGVLQTASILFTPLGISAIGAAAAGGSAGILLWRRSRMPKR